MKKKLIPNGTKPCDVRKEANPTTPKNGEKEMEKNMRNSDIIPNENGTTPSEAVEVVNPKLEKLVNSKKWTDRIKAAEAGYALDRLILDEQYDIRVVVARQGYGLDELVNDKSHWVRQEVAEQCGDWENNPEKEKLLAQLINDKSFIVRIEVAALGYGLNRLVEDDNWCVRFEVARQDYALDKLSEDKNEYVRMRATASKLGYGLKREILQDIAKQMTILVGTQELQEGKTENLFVYAKIRS